VASAGSPSLTYDFDVIIDRLNVDKYMPPKKAAENRPSQASRPGTAHRSGGAQGADVNGNHKAGQLQISNVKAANVRVDVRAKGGNLAIDPLSANPTRVDQRRNQRRC
jgi:AsmA protein